MRREGHSLRPPCFKNISCLIAKMGETADSGRNLGLNGSVKNVICPVNLALILNRPPRIEIRAENG
jgi:hypothetical protein